MMNWYRDHAVSVAAFNKLGDEEKAGKFPIGLIKKSDAPEFSKVYSQLIERINERSEE